MAPTVVGHHRVDLGGGPARCPRHDAEAGNAVVVAVNRGKAEARVAVDAPATWKGAAGEAVTGRFDLALLVGEAEAFVWEWGPGPASALANSAREFWPMGTQGPCRTPPRSGIGRAAVAPALPSSRRQGLADPAKLAPGPWQAVTEATPDRTPAGLLGMAGAVAARRRIAVDFAARTRVERVLRAAYEVVTAAEAPGQRATHYTAEWRRVIESTGD